MLVVTSISATNINFLPSQSEESYILLLGFGSLLRAMGNQISKTTNNDMCRDLTGRRIGDVNKEKKMKEWYSKESERKEEKTKMIENRRNRRRALLESDGRQGAGPVVELQDFKEQKEAISASLQVRDCIIFLHIVTPGICMHSK